MSQPAWIAADWGTSTLRAWAMGADGAVLDARRSADGMGTLEPGPQAFEAALLALIDGWLPSGRTVPVVACGMVGARQGWAEADYLPVPARPHADGGLTRAPARDPRISLHIAAGMCQSNPPDVMRGEETQIAGLLALKPGFEGVACLPGTHTKWAQVVGGEVFHFASFMTGELYALLGTASVLRHSIGKGALDAGIFAEALSDTLAHPDRIGAKLFSLRAADLLRGDDPVHAANRLSGYLLGLELAGAKPYWLGQEIALVASGDQVQRYEIGFEHIGASYSVHDPDAAVLAGLTAAHGIIRDGEKTDDA